MRQNLAAYLDTAITFVLLIVAGLTPLLFFNQMTEFYEIPKLTFLLFATILLLGMWIFSWIAKGKIIIQRSPLDIPLLILLIVILASTYFSSSRDIAIYGNFPGVHGSAVSWITYIALYFVTASHLRNSAHIKTVISVLYGSAVVVALLGLLAFFHIYLPLDFTQAANFTPTGSTFSTVALLLLLLPLPMVSLIYQNKYLPMPLAVVSAILFGITITLLASIPTLICLAIAFVLCFFAAKRKLVGKALGMLAIPVGISLLTFFAAYVLPGGLHSLETNYPKEIQLPLDTSWKVSASALRDAPLLGTGPDTYLFNFTTYKPAEYNQQPYWNFSFDAAYNEFLQILGTLGLVGLLAVSILALVVLIISWKSLVKEHEENDATKVFTHALAVSSIVAIMLLIVHPTTLVSIVISFFVFATLMALQKTVKNKTMEIAIGIKVSAGGTNPLDLLPIIVFIIFLVLALPLLYQIVNAAEADYYHRQALTLVNTNGTLTYQDLQKAESLNPRIDLYRVDMAQTNFALANALATQKANAKVPLTDQEKQTIQTLLSQAVNEGRASVILSPRSARNWEVLGSIYRNIAGVAQNALAFSLDAYGQAIQRDPLNPALRVNVGGIYYLVKNYDLAIRFFTDAANLKPDYTNAYYNLAIALRDKGDMQNAQLVAGLVVQQLQKTPNSPDYQTAQKLLADLKSKTASTQPAPAAQTNSALSGQGSTVQPVTNLQNPPSITPVPSVKPNPNAKLPSSQK